jgi:3-dehydroquinate dehydratase-2
MKKVIYIINGANLNLLGRREIDIYGNLPFDQILEGLRERFNFFDIHFFQSNIEGVLIDKIQEVGFSCDGLIFNPGGYSHTSISLGDTLAAITSPVIEVHLSNIHGREEYRTISYTAKHSLGIISGFGPESYALALAHFQQRFS